MGSLPTLDFLLWNSRARSWGGVSRKSVTGIDLKRVCASGDKGVRRAKRRLVLMTHRTRRWEAAAIGVAQTVRSQELTTSMVRPPKAKTFWRVYLFCNK